MTDETLNVNQTNPGPVDESTGPAPTVALLHEASELISMSRQITVGLQSMTSKLEAVVSALQAHNNYLHEDIRANDEHARNVVAAVQADFNAKTQATQGAIDMTNRILVNLAGV